MAPNVDLKSIVSSFRLLLYQTLCFPYTRISRYRVPDRIVDCMHFIFGDNFSADLLLFMNKKIEIIILVQIKQ